MKIMNMPGFTAEDSLYKTSGHYQTGREVNEMTIPGFTAEFAVSMAGRGYRETVNAFTDDSRASVFMAAVRRQGIGGTTCELDSTLTVEEAGGTSTTNYYKCTTNVETGGGGSGPGPSEPLGERRDGRRDREPPSRDRQPPPPPKNYNPSEGGKCNAEKGIQGTENWSRVYTGSYKKVFDNWACCAPSGGCVTCPDKHRFGESVHFCKDGHSKP